MRFSKGIKSIAIILFWIMNNLQQLQPQVFELELVVQGQWQAVGGCALPKKI